VGLTTPPLDAAVAEAVADDIIVFGGEDVYVVNHSQPVVVSTLRKYLPKPYQSLM
jgi:hypothetical protein